jgi:hypothetical protein
LQPEVAKVGVGGSIPSKSGVNPAESLKHVIIQAIFVTSLLISRPKQASDDPGRSGHSRTKLDTALILALHRGPCTSDKSMSGLVRQD